MGNLEGRTALVTGASRGTGAAIALRLAQDGANIVLTYASAEARAADVVTRIEAFGCRAVAIQVDSGDPAAVDTAAVTFGRLDVLVNNAGVALLRPLETMTSPTSTEHSRSTSVPPSSPPRPQFGT